MISSVIYTPAGSSIRETSTFAPSKSPLFQIIICKAVVVVLTFLLGDILPQLIAAIIISALAGIQFWVTKNLGRLYLHAAWSVDTSSEEDVWIYEANFKSPAQLEDVFWYAQVLYAVMLAVAIVLVAAAGKFSLAAAVLIAFAANYVNFYAFSKIIALRNSGVFDKIAGEAEADGELKETIKLPMVHRSTIGPMRNSNIEQMHRSSIGPVAMGSSNVIRSPVVSHKS